MPVPVTITTAAILSLHRDGLTPREIANKCKDITPNAVYRRLHRRGIRVNEKRCKFDEHFFDSIDNEQKAYWLGFCYADGCVLNTEYKGQQIRALRFGLSSLDSAHLRFFLTDIKASNAMCFCNNKKECRVSLNSRHLVDTLESLGCVSRKSLLISSLPNIDPKWKCHFIRGYFDGDGCICYQGKCARVSILGTKKFLNSVRRELSKNGVFFTEPKKQSGTKIWVLAGNGNKKAKDMYEYLYSGSSRYLLRKKEKFHAIL